MTSNHINSKHLSEIPLPLLPPEKEVVDEMRQHDLLSRTDLARLTGFSRAKITPVVSKLVHTGILTEVGDGLSQGGRRPSMLSFNNGLGYVAGVDIGATSLDIALADFGGQIIERHSEVADVRDGPNLILSRVRKLVTDMLESHDLPHEQLYAIGLGVPGPVEFSTGLLIAPPIMPGWEAFPIQNYLREVFPIARVVVDNDVNVMALGELSKGIGKDVENFLFIKIGTGIGCGIVCNGQIYRGINGCAGDVGHICVDRNGPICHCGNTGCLEAMAAGPAIAARAMEVVRASGSEQLAKRLAARGGTLTAEDVGAAAAAGDRASLEIIQTSGQMIGDTLAGLVNFFNPALILIGGGVSNIGFQLLSSIRQAVLRRSTSLSTRNLRIDYSSLGAEAGVRGAIALALEHVFIVRT
ncbi:MAG: ROK family protein [Anaerolineae bacterium]|nr:ROK family protein [Anaerolineae bacterium]MCI0608257.1 ROK family protein [Anaerolineae bacterium]